MSTKPAVAKHDGVEEVENEGGSLNKEGFLEVVAMLAQARINIHEGHTNIEKGSRVYRALGAFADAVSKGQIMVTLDGKGPFTWSELTGR